MLVALGIILIVTGGIVAFAIDAAIEGVDLLALGYILIGGGVLALISGAIQGAGYASMGNKRMKSERSVTPDGNHVVEETQVR